MKQLKAKLLFFLVMVMATSTASATTHGNLPGNLREIMCSLAGKGTDIQVIDFQTNSSVTSSTVISDGEYPVYAEYDADLHKVTLYTAAEYFLAPEEFSPESQESGHGGLFYAFSSLVRIDNLSSLNTENMTSMYDMFSKCSSLQSLDVSNFNTQNVTDMRGTFQGCSSLTSLDVSNFDTRNVTSLNGTFKDCTSLTSLDLSKWDTQNVKYMGWMCTNCTNLTSVNVSNFNMLKVTDVGAMFEDCVNLVTMDLSKWDTPNVTTFERMFNGCSSLKSVDLSGINTGATRNFSRMFNGCTALETIINTSNTPQTISSVAFSTSTLSAITLQVKWDAVDAYNTADVWKDMNVTSLTNAHIDGIYYNLNADGTAQVTHNPIITNGTYHVNVVVPATILDGSYTVTSIGDFAFYACNGLYGVQLPESITEIGSYAFCNSALNSINIPSSVKTIKDSAFRNTTNMSTVTIPDGLKTLGTKAFYGSAITSFAMPSAIEEIGDSALCKCRNMEGKVILPSTLNTLGTGAFNYCEKITEVYIPASIKNIPSNAFSRCFAVEKITIEDGIEIIADSAFMQCRNVRELTIPASVTSIGSYAIWKMESLKELYVKATTPPTLTENSIGSLSHYIFVNIPICTLSDYQNDPYWSLWNLREPMKFDFMNDADLLADTSNPDFLLKTEGNVAVGSAWDTGNNKYQTLYSVTSPARLANVLAVQQAMNNTEGSKGYWLRKDHGLYCHAAPRAAAIQNLKVGHKIIFKTKSINNLTFYGESGSGENEGRYTVETDYVGESDATYYTYTVTMTSNGNLGFCTAKSGEIASIEIISDFDNPYYPATPIAATSASFGNDSQKTITLAIGEEYQTQPTVTPEYATSKRVTTASADKAVAVTNNETGVITAVAPGTTTITVKPEGAEEATDELTVNVINAKIYNWSNGTIGTSTDGYSQLAYEDGAKLILVGNREKAYSTNTTEYVLIRGKKPVKLSNGAQNMFVAPEGTYIKSVTIYSVVNESAEEKDPSQKYYWKEVNGVPYSVDETESTYATTEFMSLHDFETPDAVTFDLGSVSSFTFNNYGKQLYVALMVEYTTEAPVMPTALQLNKNEITELTIDASETLTASLLPEGEVTNSQVLWTSSDSNIVSVSKSGVITGNAKGTATIIATSVADKSITATCEVTVVEENTTPDPDDNPTDDPDDDPEGSDIESSTDINQYPIALYINDVESRAGDLNLELNMKCEEENITAYQCDVYLPEGVTWKYTTDKRGKVIYDLPTFNEDRTDDSYHTITPIAKMADGSYSIIVYSMDKEYILDTDGVLMYLPLEISDEMEAGDYNIIMKNIVLTDVDMNQTMINKMVSKLTIPSYKIGDVNGDTFINVTDIVGIIDLMRGEGEECIKEAADVNGDTFINVTDIVGIINLMRGESNAAKASFMTEASSFATTAKGVMAASEDCDKCNLEVIPFTVANGTTASTVKLNLNNPGDEFTAFQCDVDFPEGIAWATTVDKRGNVKVTQPTFDAEADRTDASYHTINAGFNNDNGLMNIVVYSLDKETIFDEEGAVLDMPFVFDANLKPGVYDITLRNIVLSRVDMTDEKPADYTFSVMVGSPEDNAIALHGHFTADAIEEFNTVLSKNTNVVSVDFSDAKAIDGTMDITTGNKNALVYVAEGVSIDNTKNVVVGGTCTNLVLTDGNDFTVAKPFTAVKVSCDVTVSESLDYRTLVLPYNCNVPSGFEAYEVGSLSGNILSLVQVESITANKPVILKNAGTASLSATNVTVNATAATLTNGKLVGTYTKTSAPVGSYVLQNQGGNVAFYQVVAGKQPVVGPFRAYLEASEAGAKSTLMIGDGATALLDTKSGALIENVEGVFNAAGVRKANITDGVNIIRTADGEVKKIMK